MRIQVNLASRPFVELRPFFLRLRLIMAALALLGLGVAFAAHILSARAARQQAELDRLREQTIAIQQGRLRTEQRMRQPVNARVLDRAHFLNTLFLKKSFSWTAVMMDLENVLPNGVQVTAIEPQIAPDGNVTIRLRVGGERANAVQLVRNLERSQRFLRPRLSGEASQTRESNGAPTGRPATAQAGPLPPPGVEFDILAVYNPLPPGQPFQPGRRREPTVRVRPARAILAPEGEAGASRNVQAGYPADGVRLPVYSGAAQGRNR